MTHLEKAHRVLVTGGTGFIGSAVIEKYLRIGLEVGLLARHGSAWSEVKKHQPNLKIFFYTGEFGSVDACLQNFNPDLIVHIASFFTAEHESTDIDALIDSNIKFGTHILEAMVKNSILKFINTGTSWQYFGNKPKNPRCLYSATKQAFETILELYAASYHIKAVTLTLYDTYGPKDNRGKLIPWLIKQGSSNEPIELSPGGQLLDLVHVDDVVEAYLRAIEMIMDPKQKSYARYAVSSEEHISLKDLIKKMEIVLDRKIQVCWGAKPYRKREVMTPWTSGRLLPGWSAKIPLDTGLKSLVDPIV